MNFNQVVQNENMMTITSISLFAYVVSLRTLTSPEELERIIAQQRGILYLYLNIDGFNPNH